LRKIISQRYRSEISCRGYCRSLLRGWYDDAEEIPDRDGINRILEAPGARILWLTDSLGDIEASVLGRFTYSLHFEVLNRLASAGCLGSMTPHSGGSTARLNSTA
jgi:hypothetical protein